MTPDRRTAWFPRWPGPDIDASTRLGPSTEDQKDGGRVGQCSGRPPTAKRLTVGGGAADDGAMTVRVLRLVLAVLIVGAALGGAFVLHGYRLRYLSTCPAIGAPSGSRCLRELRPGWVDPAALGVIVLGVAVAMGVV